MHRWRFRCIANASVQAVADLTVEARSLPLALLLSSKVVSCVYVCACIRRESHDFVCLCDPGRALLSHRVRDGDSDFTQGLLNERGGM
jgi:hypothetical protein